MELQIDPAPSRSLPKTTYDVEPDKLEITAEPDKLEVTTKLDKLETPAKSDKLKALLPTLEVP